MRSGSRRQRRAGSIFFIVRNIVIAPGAPSGTPGSATIGPVNSPTGPADVRRRNLSLVLRHIAAYGPCARTELAEATGLVHGSITALTAELIGSGLVHEVGLASSGARGRPRRLLELAPGRVLTDRKSVV